MNAPALAAPRRFATIAEIELLDGYATENPVTVSNYKRLLGPYHLSGEELACCIQRESGNLCRQAHLRGWVAALSDGSISVVGGDCAKEKFGVDSAISRDISVANNALSEIEIEARLRGLLDERDQKLEEVTNTLTAVVWLTRQVAELRSLVGPAAFRALENLGRSGAGTVVVQGITPAVHDKDGELIREQTSIAVPVGTLAGIRVCSPSTLPTSADALRGLRKHYDAANLDALSNRKLRRALTAALADQPRLIAAARQVIADGEAFLANDFMPVCFLVSDSASRERIAKWARPTSASQVDYVSNKNWLQKLEAALCKTYNVKRIQIPT